MSSRPARRSSRKPKSCADASRPASQYGTAIPRKPKSTHIATNAYTSKRIPKRHSRYISTPTLEVRSKILPPICRTICEKKRLRLATSPSIRSIMMPGVCFLWNDMSKSRVCLAISARNAFAACQPVFSPIYVADIVMACCDSAAIKYQALIDTSTGAAAPTIAASTNCDSNPGPTNSRTLSAMMRSNKRETWRRCGQKYVCNNAR